MKNAVRKHTRNVAHPVRDAFVRMLRLGGATEETIEYARTWERPICIQSQALGIPRSAKVCDVHDFNDAVALYL